MIVIFAYIKYKPHLYIIGSNKAPEKLKEMTTYTHSNGIEYNVSTSNGIVTLSHPNAHIQDMQITEEKFNTLLAKRAAQKGKRFTKGQIIYVISTNYSSELNEDRSHDHQKVAIFKYKVDGCGLKQMTFENDFLGHSRRKHSPRGFVLYGTTAADGEEMNEKYHETEESARASAKWYCQNVEKEIKAWNRTLSHSVIETIFDQTI